MNLTRKQLRSKGIDIIITPVFIKEAKKIPTIKNILFTFTMKKENQ